VDEFADVYGVYLALTGDGYSWRDLWNTADYLKRELVLVPGVRKISIGGEQQEVVYLEMSRSRLAELGIPLERIGNILQSQNVVADAGQVRVEEQYLRIKPTGAFQSVKAIGDVLISSDDKKLIFLRDIAEIKRAYIEVPKGYFFVNGKPALTLGISMLGGENVVAVGAAVDRRLIELSPNIPLGMELQQIYNQPAEVEKSVNGFIVSVAQAVAIVIIVLLLFIGI
jgi:multidrug efflux pump subunit AcrB